MDLLGFARQRKLRQFRNPSLSALGLFAVSYTPPLFLTVILTFANARLSLSMNF
jgi:hypothetical protein